MTGIYYDRQREYINRYLASYLKAKYSGYTLKEVPFEWYSRPQKDDKNRPKNVACSFLNDVVNSATEPDIDDIFKSKTELSQDRIDLILGAIDRQEQVRDQNLSMLYSDLFYVDRMQKDRPFPDNYARDTIWLKMAEAKLRIYDSIRKELNNHERNMSMNSKELLEALVDFKRQNQKQRMFADENIAQNETDG